MSGINFDAMNEDMGRLAATFSDGDYVDLSVGVSSKIPTTSTDPGLGPK